MSESPLHQIPPAGTPACAPATAPVAMPGGGPRRRWLRRGPWENASAVVTAGGLFMLMQPFRMELYTWSFLVILVGSAAFVITAHFAD